MTPIFTLAKDHLRRHWKSLTLMSLAFALFASFMTVEASVTLYLTKTAFQRLDAYYSLICLYYINIYAYYTLLAWRIGMNGDFHFLRLLRTLPLRESTSANLVWSMAVVAPPVFSFVIVLLLGCLAFYFGKAHSLPIAGPLLFLLLATLCSGVLAFLQAWRMYGPLLPGHHMQKDDTVSASYVARMLFGVACAGAVVALVFCPPPTRWSGLTPLNLAGMGLAAFLTWKSYPLRYWLLQFDLPLNAIARRPAKLEDLLKSQEIDQSLKLEDLLKAKGIDPLHYDPVTAALVNLSKSRKSAPLRHGSALAAVAQDLKIIVRGSLITLLLVIGLIHLMLFCLAWSGLVPPGLNIYEFFASAIVFIAVIVAATQIGTQFGPLLALRAVRALPLTGNQCVWLFLSYPYAVTLAVVPCLTAYLWLTGFGHPSILLLGGILLSAGLCPFAMFLGARFGVRSFFIIMVGFIFVGELVFILILPRFGVYLTPQSPPILCAGGLLFLAVLGIVGFYGLRHLIENNSAAYKRKPSPQLFAQWLGR